MMDVRILLKAQTIQCVYREDGSDILIGGRAGGEEARHAKGDEEERAHGALPGPVAYGGQA
jgi:hypothetical protein